MPLSVKVPLIGWVPTITLVVVVVMRLIKSTTWVALLGSGLGEKTKFWAVAERWKDTDEQRGCEGLWPWLPPGLLDSA